MKKQTLMVIALTFIGLAAQAKSYTFECAEVRTTEQQAVDNSKLKSFVLSTNGSKAKSNSAVAIASMDERLLTGGAPLMHDSYGGYLTTANGDIFRCQREI